MWIRCLLSYDPGVWKYLNTAVKPTPLYVSFFLGSVVCLVMSNHAVVQNKF